MKALLYTGIACLLALSLAAMVTAICYISVRRIAKDKVYSDIRSTPYNKVGLLLGTNPSGPNGGKNYYFIYRIDAAVQLYKAGKIKYILVSGDNHIKEYDEPQCMKEALMERGVPESAIILDYAGFRTLDSIVRAKEVFGQTEFTIISQRFHNERAVCLARHYGISAIGFNARDVKRTATGMRISYGRECLARVKMYIDLLLNKQPKFLGEPIVIE